MPRGTAQAPSFVGAAFPQMPSRGNTASPHARTGAAPPDRPDSASSHREVVGRREKYVRPQPYPSSLKQRLLQLKAEEMEERQRLQECLRSSSRFCLDRRLMQKEMGVTALYAPEAALQGKGSVMPRSKTASPSFGARTTRPRGGWLV